MTARRWWSDGEVIAEMKPRAKVDPPEPIFGREACLDDLSRLERASFENLKTAAMLALTYALVPTNSRALIVGEVQQALRWEFRHQRVTHVLVRHREYGTSEALLDASMKAAWGLENPEEEAWVAEQLAKLESLFAPKPAPMNAPPSNWAANQGLQHQGGLARTQGQNEALASMQAQAAQSQSAQLGGLQAGDQFGSGRQPVAPHRCCCSKRGHGRPICEHCGGSTVPMLQPEEPKFCHVCYRTDLRNCTYRTRDGVRLAWCEQCEHAAANERRRAELQASLNKSPAGSGYSVRAEDWMAAAAAGLVKSPDDLEWLRKAGSDAYEQRVTAAVWTTKPALKGTCKF